MDRVRSRVVDLMQAGTALADEIGAAGDQWPELIASVDDSSLVLTLQSDHRDDYALAAGAGPGGAGARRRPDPATGIAVRLRSAAIDGTGTLDASGRATLPLIDAQRRALTESAAWDLDWSMASVVVGAETAESREIRERVRRWARARQNLPPRDAFVAEILAAESAY